MASSLNSNSIRSGVGSLSPSPHESSEDQRHRQPIRSTRSNTPGLASQCSSPTNTPRPFPSSSPGTLAPYSSTRTPSRPHLSSPPTPTHHTSPLLSPRPKPTLAMSIQVPRAPSHSFSPSTPSEDRGRDHDHAPAKSRPRSQSRSERLLRETLRKADELARASPTKPAFRKSKGKEKCVPGDHYKRVPGDHYKHVPSDCACEDTWALCRPEMVRGHTQTRSRNNAPAASSRNHSRKSSYSSQGEGPHGAVLRSRLEGVLRGAGVDEPTHLPTPAPSPPSCSSSSQEEEGEGEGMLTPPPTPPPKSQFRTSSTLHPRSPTTPTPHRTSPTSRTSPSTSRTSPSTPPTRTPPTPTSPAPAFDAHRASERCKNMTGLVSFRDLEGLGWPGEEGEETRRGVGGLWGRVFG